MRRLSRHPTLHRFSPFARHGHQRAEHFATTPAILLAGCAITHRTSPKAELFCKICMMDRAAAMIARHAMDAYYCWLFRESLMQLEGELRERRICRSPFF